MTFTKKQDINSNEIKKYKFKTNTFSERIRKTVSHILNKNNIDHDHETTRAIGNAMRHGEFPVKVRVYIYENKHILVRINDSGSGFNYRKTIELYNKGKKYFHNHGKGTRILAQSNAKIWFNKSGNEINIYF